MSSEVEVRRPEPEHNPPTLNFDHNSDSSAFHEFAGDSSNDDQDESASRVTYEQDPQYNTPSRDTLDTSSMTPPSKPKTEKSEVGSPMTRALKSQTTQT